MSLNARLNNKFATIRYPKANSFLDYILWSREGALVIGLVVLIGAAILFVPEISRLTGGGGDAPPTKNYAEDEEKESDDVEDTTPKRPSDPLDDIVSDSDDRRSYRKQQPQRDDYDRDDVPRRRRDRQYQPKPQPMQLKSSAVVVPKKRKISDAELLGIMDPDIPKERLEERRKLSEALNVRPLTPEVLSQPVVIKPIEKAVNDSETLLKVFDERYLRSKFALVDYVNGLKLILKPEKSPLSPEDLVKYVGLLDVKVTQSFIEERVERTEYLIWRAISLGPLVTSIGKDNKFSYTPPFKADIVLVKMDLMHRYMKKVMQGKRVKTPAHNQWTVTVDGVVQGRDAHKVEIYHGKTLIKLVDLPAINKNHKGELYRNFKFNYVDRVGTRPYTFRAVNSDGMFVQKTYSLVAKSVKKFVKNDNGKFLIPGNIYNQRSGQPPSFKLDGLLLLEKSSSDDAFSDPNSFQGANNFSADGNMSFSSFDSNFEKELKNF